MTTLQRPQTWKGLSLNHIIDYFQILLYQKRGPFILLCEVLLLQCQCILVTEQSQNRIHILSTSLMKLGVIVRGKMWQHILHVFTLKPRLLLLDAMRVQENSTLIFTPSVDWTSLWICAREHTRAAHEFEKRGKKKTHTPARAKWIQQWTRLHLPLNEHQSQHQGAHAREHANKRRICVESLACGGIMENLCKTLGKSAPITCGLAIEGVAQKKNKSKIKQTLGCKQNRGGEMC